MIKVRDGYGKLIGSDYNGNIAHVLLSNGGNLQYAVGSTASTLVLRNASGQIESSVASTVAPFVISSTKVNANLNADLLDGFLATGLFQSLTSAADKNLYIKIGNTEKEVPLLYASYLGGVTKEGLFTELSNVNDTTNPNSIKVTIGGTTKYLKVAYSDLAGKVVCSSSTNNVDRPIVVTNTSNGVYYSTKVTLNYSTGNVTAPTFTGALIGNADTATTASKLSTVSKTAWGLTYWTSGGVPTSISGDMTGVGNITISATGNKDYFINFLYNSTPTYSWRLGYLGSGSGNANYFVIDSSKSSGGTWHRVLQLGNETLEAVFTGEVTAAKFIGPLNNTLTFSAGAFSAKTYNNSETVTVNIPTHTSHLTNNSGFLTAHLSLANYVTLNGALTISGVKTFSTLLKFTVALGTSPFIVSSTTKVDNLNADLLDGKHATDFMQYSSGGKYVQANLINSELWSLAGGNGYIEYYDSGTWFNSQWGKVTAHYGFEGSLNGNASSATKLQTARTIWGQLFDGTSNVDGILEMGLSKVYWNDDVNNYFIVVNGAGKMYHTSYYGIFFSTGGSNRLAIDSYGNVGIGTTSPSYKLHVNGQAYSTGYVRSGSSDSYVLLGGGGHKALSDFAMASAYVKKAGDTMTGPLTISTANWGNLLVLNRVNNGENWGPSIIFKFDGTHNGALSMQSNLLYIGDNGNVRYKAWHEGNDGSGSGLDADLLDGKHASAFATSGHTHSYLTSGATLSGNNHAAALKTYFTNNKASIPRDSLNTYYSSAMSNGSLYFGYFLSGYDTTPYGGFFVAHYNEAYYVGILNGSFTLQRILTSTNYSSYLGYIGTTAVLKSSAAQALTGITNATLSGRLTFTTAAETASISFLNGELIDGYGNVLLGTNSASWNVFNSSRSSLITVLKSGNVGIGTTSPSYKLHVTGSGYFNGNITVGGNQYVSNSTYGINMLNSDIALINSLYFADLADSSTEGIHFYRSTTTWDSLTAKNGILYFSGNRAISDTTLTPVFSALANSGNNISITIGGQNRTLTPAYATKAGNADTVDGIHASGFILTNSLMIHGAYAVIPTYNGETGWHRIATIDGGTGYGSWILYLCGNWSWASNTTAILHINTMHTTAKITQVSGIVGFVTDVRLVPISANNYYVDVYINYSGANTPGTVYCYFLGNGAITTRTTAEKITASVSTAASITLVTGTRTNDNSYAAHFYENSDVMLKTNIKSITDSDNMPILKSFDWKSDGSRGYGLIAQELEAMGYPELVSGELDGTKTVNYSAALSLIVGKLQVKIKELEKEIEILKNKN